jgi:hypothetical protein
VSYDLAFWDGPRPADDEEASTAYDEIWDRLDDTGDATEPSEKIRSLIAALEARWPGDDPNAPWAVFPLDGDAIGDTLYLNLTFGRPDTDLEFIASTARGLGLVCFDPQLEGLL